MKLRYAIGLIVLCVSHGVFAQQADTLPRGAVAQRSIRASASVEAFRPVGDMRVWQFFAKQTTFGQLTSIVTGRHEIDGRSALTLRESLEVDFTKIGGEAHEIIRGESYVTSSGRFAGCDFEIGPPEQAERLVMSLSDDGLDGYYTRGGEELDIDQPMTAESFFWDPHFVDQLEIYLGLQDLEIGTVINDSIFLPQSLIHARIAGQVVYFMWQEIYKGKIDSVFVIRLTEPSTYQLFFTPDKKLVRVDMVDQGVRVYQDLVRQTKIPGSSEAATSREAPFSLRALLFKLPHYVAFVLVLGLSILLLAPRAFRWSSSYLALLIGAILYIVTVLAVNPALIWVARHLVDLRSVSGSSFYFAGTLLPLMTGLIQAAFIYAGLYFIGRLSASRTYRYSGLGVFLGGAFGLAESMYLSGWQTEVLFAWPLLERACMIIMHAASGALIGRFMTGDRVHLVWAIIAAAAVNGAMRYLPLLVQTRMIDMEAVHFIMALGTLVYLLGVVVLSRRTPARPQELSPEAVPPNQD